MIRQYGFPSARFYQALPRTGKRRLAAGEGFEPSQTESESGVLPLHQPARFYSAEYTPVWGYGP